MAQHRTLLKILLNPILRRLGWSIVSVIEGDRFARYEVRRYPEHCRLIPRQRRGGQRTTPDPGEVRPDAPPAPPMRIDQRTTD